MEIKLNSQIKRIPDEVTIQQLLDEMIPGKQNGIAVAVNSFVVIKRKWSEHFLRENDEVLIIKAAQGG